MKLIKKTAAMLAFLSVFTGVMTSCDDDDDPVPGLKCDPDKVEVVAGETVTVTIGEGTAPYSVTSSDNEIATATVEENTVTITGVKEGKATINVSDAENHKGKISVTVKSEEKSGLELDTESVTLAVGDEEVVTVKNGTAPYTAVAEDTEIATVSVQDDKITVKGEKAGTTTVTIKDKDNKEAVISVTIK